MKAILNKTHEILFKPYSKEVIGYLARILNVNYIVLNSNLAESETDAAHSKLSELSTKYPQHEFILLQRDKEPYMTEKLDIHEMRVA